MILSRDGTDLAKTGVILEGRSLVQRTRGLVFGLFSEDATRYALMQRIWSVAAGPVTAALVLKYTTAIDQGYYYTFLSSASIVMFFELGFGNIIVQWIAHSWAGETASGAANGLDVCDRSKEFRLIALIAKYWYAGAGLLFFLIAVPLGVWWLRGGTNDASNWLAAWLLFGAGIGANLAIAGSVSIAEGLGKIGFVYRLRFLAGFFGSLCLWIALRSGAGCYSLCVQQIVQTCVIWWQIRPMRKRLGSLPGVGFADLYVFWRKRLLPLQWRSAIVVASSFFLYQSTTLIAFRMLGPVDAGKIGFAFSIGTMLSSLGLLLLSVNAVKLGILAAGGRWRELSRSFRRYVCIGLAVCAAAGVAVDLALIVGVRVHFIKAERLMGQSILWCIFGAALVSTATQSIITRVRCLKQEPFAPENFMVALLWPCLAFWSVAHFGMTGLGLAYLAMVTFGLGIPVYVKYRRNERTWRGALKEGS